MSVLEKLFLNPFEKLTRYGRFPTTFFVHALLVVLVTFQVMHYSQRDIRHAMQTASHFSSLFLGSPRGSTTLWQPGELQDALENAVENIFLINDVTFNDVIYTQRGREALTAPEDPEQLKSLPVQLRFRNATVQRVELSRQAFEQERLRVKAYLELVLPVLYSRNVRELAEILISFALSETVHEMPAKGHFLWHLTLRFDGTNVGRFVGSLGYSLETARDEFRGWSHFHMNLCTILLALVSMCLVGRKLLIRLVVLRKLREEDPALPWSEGAALFSWWWGVSAATSATQVWATATCMGKAPNVIDRFSLLGWSCCLTWLNICQYLEFFPGMYVTFSTTGKGLAKVCKYMISVFPILTAFMFLGTCNFWQASTFGGVLSSYASLFSLLNGDMVHDAFDELGTVAGWAGHAYLYVFIFMFIYIILNVNITIIEEAYYSAHFQGLRHLEQVEYNKKLLTPLETLAPRFQRALSDEPSIPEGREAFAQSSGNRCVNYLEHQAPRLPNEANTGTASPLLHPQGAAASLPLKPRMRGCVSPRILDHPQLQASLIAAFPSTPSSESASVSSTSNRRVTEGTNRSPVGAGSAGAGVLAWPCQGGDGRCAQSPAAAEARGTGPSADTSASAASLYTAPLTATRAGVAAITEEGQSIEGEAGGQFLPSTSCAVLPALGAKWWLTNLPQMTELLRSTPLPSRSEMSRCKEDGWEELERLVAAHSAAVTEVSLELYRTPSRT